MTLVVIGYLTREGMKRKKNKGFIMNGYHKLNLWNYLIGYYLNQGCTYAEAKKPALKDYLKLLGVNHKKM